MMSIACIIRMLCSHKLITSNGLYEYTVLSSWIKINPNF